MVDLNKRDWQIINSALALLEADVEGADEDYLPSTLPRIRETREKIHQQMARYTKPYDWTGRRPT